MITILTKPTNNWVEEILYFSIRIKRKLFNKPSQNIIYPTGPDTVLKSLINGFNRLNVRYNLNPKKINEIGKTIIVLSNIEALKQAIELKRNKKIKRLLAGPNLVVFSSDFNHIIVSPEIDICIVPSKRVLDVYVQESPTLINRIKIWSAGVDENYWKPKNNCLPNNNVIIYYKNASNYLQKKVTMLLKKYSWNLIHIKYGCYTQKEYKSALTNCIFAVFLSRKESQGIALAEAWSMNVPTIVWNPQESINLGNFTYTTSSAPYLSKKTGISWKKIKDLKEIIIHINSNLKLFCPRKWVLKNMTDIISTKSMMKIVNNIN